MTNLPAFPFQLQNSWFFSWSNKATSENVVGKYALEKCSLQYVLEFIPFPKKKTSSITAPRDTLKLFIGLKQNKQISSNNNNNKISIHKPSLTSEVFKRTKRNHSPFPTGLCKVSQESPSPGHGSFWRRKDCFLTHNHIQLWSPFRCSRALEGWSKSSTNVKLPPRELRLYLQDLGK